MSNYRTKKYGFGKFKGQIHVIESPFRVEIQFGYPSWFWFRFLPNHGCKTQIAIFNKKVNITGFSRLEIFKVCMEYQRCNDGNQLRCLQRRLFRLKCAIKTYGM